MMGKFGALLARCFLLRPKSYPLLCCRPFKSGCRNLSASPDFSVFNSSNASLSSACPEATGPRKISHNKSAVQSNQFCRPLYCGWASVNIKGGVLREVTLYAISNSLLAFGCLARGKFRFLHSFSSNAMEDKRSSSEGNLSEKSAKLQAETSEEVAAKKIHQSTSAEDLASAEHAHSTNSWKANYRGRFARKEGSGQFGRGRGWVQGLSGRRDGVQKGKRLIVVDQIFSSESVLVNRKWKLTELGEAYERQGYRPSAHHGNLEFTVASYNVLAQNLLEDNSYLYEHCSREWLQWPFRWQRLLEELKRYQPDVLCCQEINSEHFVEFFSPELEKLGYKGEFKKRTRLMHDGCATFYKTSVFDCVSVVPIEYLRQGVSALDRDNVAMIMMLRPKKLPGTSSQLCVANTHLLFNPRRGDVKLAQLMMLFAEIDQIAFLHHQASPSGMMPVYHPIILCGDLNMEPFSQLYRFVSSGNLPLYGVTVQKLSKPIPHLMSTGGHQWSGTDRQLHHSFLDPGVGISDYSQYIKVCRARRSDTEEEGREYEMLPEYVQGSGHVAHNLGFRSVYRHYMDYGTRHYAHRLPEVSTSHTRANCTVDYIFYSSGTVNFDADYNNKLQLLSRLSLLSTQEMHLVGGLPNEFVSSDHLMLSARFVLKMDEP